MKKLAASLVALSFLHTAAAGAQSVRVVPNGSQPSVSGAAELFTGSVVVEPLFGDTQHSPTTAGHPTFAPGARSNWHTHPAGQTLIVTSGMGWVQQEGGDKQQIRPGDVVHIPPNVRHWHGATATTGMRHIAIQNMVDGRNTVWMEPVSDEQYNK
jgi:quercetin dioxygenase-like cupin family protein